MGQIGIRDAHKPKKIAPECIKSIPTNLQTKLIGDGVELIWRDNTNKQLKFSIERSKNGAPFTVLLIDYVFDANYNIVKSFDTDVSGKTILYRVRACEGKHFSEYSNLSGVNTILIAPTTLSLFIVSDTAMKLTWNPSPSATGYQVERTNDEGQLTQIATTSETKFEDKNLKAAFPYGYRVRAYRGTKLVSKYSNEVIATTLASSPRHLYAKPVSKTQIDLVWFGKEEDDGYKIERKTGLQGVWKEINCNIVTQLNYSDTTCTQKTQYFYRIRSYKGNNFSVYSKEICCATR